MCIGYSPVKKNIICFLSLFLSCSCLVKAQTNHSPQDKTLVVFSLIKEGNEKKTLLELHKKLTSLGIDAVNYIDSLNLRSSPEVSQRIFDYLKRREVKNLLFYNEKKQEINLVNTNSFLSKNITPNKTIKGDSVLNKLKKSILKQPISQKTFLYSPQPEIIEKITVKAFNKILSKPNLNNQKIGINTQYNIDLNLGLVVVEEKEDYRFYYSNGINYFIGFYRGTESFLKKTYGIDGLDDYSNKETLVLVLEHTATRNKLFYFNRNTTSKENLLVDFLSN